MKMIKYMSIALLASVTLMSCGDDDYDFKFDDHSNPATSTVGKKIMGNTELIQSIFKDSTYTITPGVQGTDIMYFSNKGQRLSIFAMEIDLKHPDVSMQATVPNGDFTKVGMQEMTKQATFADKPANKVWAGVNADFYDMSTGRTRSVLHHNGAMVKNTMDKPNNYGARSFFAITNNKKALIGNTIEEYKVKSSELTFQEAVGGHHLMLRDGNLSGQVDVSVEPRTSIGVSADSTVVYVVVVDGRRFGYSVGLQVEEVAQMLKAMGAENAINLDGGGSSTYFTRNTVAAQEANKPFVIRNWPSTGPGTERKVANGLVIMSKN